MKFREDTQKIISAHCKDFNVSTYSKKCPDYAAYVKSLGGIFSKLYGVTTKPTTAAEFRDQVEYIAGIMAIWGMDYWNGKTRHRWGNGSSDAFYGKSAKLKCRGGSIGQLCQGTGGRSRITCCNYGVDTLLQHMGLKRAATDRIKTWAKWYGTVSNKKDLKVGNIVHFYNKSLNRSKPSTWSGWKHVAIVVKIEGSKIWLADFGSRFINSKNPYHYMTIDNSSKGGGEYSSYYWAGIKCFNFKETESTATTPTPTPTTPTQTVTKEEDIPVPRTVKKGSTGKAVKVVQAILGITTDGKFGSKTAEAVKKFQASKKLTVDAVVGPKTWRALLISIQ